MRGWNHLATTAETAAVSKTATASATTSATTTTATLGGLALPPPPPLPRSSNNNINNNNGNPPIPQATIAALPPPPLPPGKSSNNPSLTTYLDSQGQQQQQQFKSTTSAAATTKPQSAFSTGSDERTVVSSNLSPTNNHDAQQEEEQKQPKQQQQPPIVRDPPKKPKPLPYATFFAKPTTSPTSPSQMRSGGSSSSSPTAAAVGGALGMPSLLLAQRQVQFPILLVATEAAHTMAWKNNLLLSDLLTGVMHSSTQASTMTTTAASQGSSLPPFRSMTRAMTLQWSDVPVYFVESFRDWTTLSTSDLEAQSLLHTAAELQDSDGNLSHELDILEDQVDHLLMPKTSSSSSSSSQQQPLNNSNDGSADSQDGNAAKNTGTTKEDNLDDLLLNPMSWHEQRQRQLDQVTRDAYSLTSPLTIPWLRRYRQALDHVTSYAPHDLMACPAICLFVCTTEEDAGDAIETLQTLQLPHYLPPQYHQGLWDPQSLSQHVLVLHDQVEGPRDGWDETSLRRSLTQTFGSTATLLRVNTIAPEIATQLANEETHDLWQGGGQCGNCLSVSDRVALRNYLSSTLVINALLPALERRIARLNAIVSERKKGVRNVFKSFWRTGKTKEDLEQGQHQQAMMEGSGGGTGSPRRGMAGSANTAGGASVVVRYRHESIESQTRLLADTLFLVKDYESALATYRLIRDDYKQDKAHSYYASCQENMALCMYLMDPYNRARDIFSCLETALLSYKKAAEEERAAMPSLYGKSPTGQRSPAASHSTRSATRLCLVMISPSSAAAAVSAGRNLEVADLLASSSSNETALGAAVLLEQSSAHYYKNEKYRKYAFHMLMSGHMFRTAQQEHHAFRCFTSALHIYRDAQWDELHNHIRSALAAQLYSMDRMALSLQLYAQLISGGTAPRVSLKSQQKFINHVLEICNEHPKKALAGADRMVYPVSMRRERSERIAPVVQFTRTALRVLELPNLQLPYIDDDSIMVIAEEGGNATATSNNNNNDRSLSETENSGIETAAVLGRTARGDSEVWDQLTLECIAELRAEESSLKARTNGTAATPTSEDDTVVVTQVLSKIEDPQLRRVIAEMDKERAHCSLVERARKSSTYKATPPSRALKEPLAVECTLHNPLGIPIDLDDLQIVARMTAKQTTTTTNTPPSPPPPVVVCTNEDAIQITPLASHNDRRIWTFDSSILEFSVPQFCRVSQPQPTTTTAGAATDESKMKWKSGLEVEPFFVVTKTTLTLPAETTQTISASVCPLVEGDLEILGLRCRLLDSVWMFHPFNVKGELLQNTRSNRANRVRAESLLLKAKVERGMPCLTADFVQPLRSSSLSTTVVGEPGPLLQGQVSKWNLRLTNVGTAPAKSITVKTNLPWITIWDGGDEDRSSKSYDELERQTTSYSVGPTGTLLRIPIDGFGLQVDGELQPGESVDVAVDLRTFGSGCQDFYMLFRYELVEQQDASVPYRWLRKMLEVPLFPSLTFNASLVPSYAKDAEHVLSVEITNYRSDQPDQLNLLVDQLTLASRSYKLEPLPGQIVAPDGQVRLGWQERVTLHYRVLPLDEVVSSTCLLSQSNPSGSGGATRTVPACLSSLLSFLCLERAHAQFEDTRLSHQRALARAAAGAAGGAGGGGDDGDDQLLPRSISEIRRANTNVGDEETGRETQERQESQRVLESVAVAPTSIRKLSPLSVKNSGAFAVLVCSWKSEDGSIEGQHHIRGLPIRPLMKKEVPNNSNNSTTNSATGCPIVITGTHPSVVSNDFTRGPASVPLKITLRNRFVSTDPVRFELSLEGHDRFDWTGPECVANSLTGGEALHVPLKAIVPAAGVYNLQTVRLTILNNTNSPNGAATLSSDENKQQQRASSSPPPQPPLSFRFPLQWNVVVQEAAVQS